MRLDLPIPEEFITKIETCDYKVPITSIMGRIKSSGAIAIVRDGKYAGVVDNRTIARGNFAKQTPTASGRLATKLPSIDSRVTIERALSYFYNTNAKVLPFIEGKRITGALRREKLLEAILSAHTLSKSTAGDAMRSPVITIDYKESVAEAVALMRAKKVNRLLVLNNERISGILTLSDVAFSLKKSEEKLPEMKTVSHSIEGIEAGSMAESPVYIVDYASSMDSAIRQLIERNVSALTVMRGGKPTGILTTNDIFKVALESRSEEAPNVVISELDARTVEYGPDIVDAISKTVGKMAKFKRFGVSGVYLTVKSGKAAYEIKARLVPLKGREMTVSASDPLLDTTIKHLCERLYKVVEERKDTAVTNRRSTERYYVRQEEVREGE